MKKSKSKFTSNNIIKSKATKLVSESVMRNMKFTDNSSISKVNQIEINGMKKEVVSTNLVNMNASDMMKNFFAKNFSQPKMKHKSNINSKDKRNFDLIKIRTKSSHKIANEIITKKQDSSFFNILINSSNDMGYQSSTLGKSLLDVSINKSCRLGISKERKKKEDDTILRYDEYLTNKKSNYSQRQPEINFSYSNNYNNDSISGIKNNLIEDYINVNTTSQSKLTSRKDLNYSSNNSKSNNKELINILVNRDDDISKFRENKIPKSKEYIKVNPSKIKTKKYDSMHKDAFLNLSKDSKSERISKIKSIESKKFNEEHNKLKNINIFKLKIKDDMILNQEENFKNQYINPSSNMIKIEDNFDCSPENNIDLTAENITNILTKEFINNGLKRDKYYDLTNENLKYSAVETSMFKFEASNLSGHQADKRLSTESVYAIKNYDSENKHLEFTDDEEEDYCGDIDEFNNDHDEIKNRNINKIYKSNVKVGMEEINEDINYDNLENPTKKYDEMLNKFLFNNNEVSNSLNDSIISKASKSSAIDCDIDSILNNRNTMKKIKSHYKKEIRKLEKELIQLYEMKNSEFNKLKEKKEIEMKNLKEKLIKERENLLNDMDKRKKNGNDDYVKIKAELNTLKSNLGLRENNYRNTIKSLLGDLRNISSWNSGINQDINNSETDINETIIKEINEIIEELDTNQEDSNKVKNLSCFKNLNNQAYNNSSTTIFTRSKNENNRKNSIININENFNDDSMLCELEEFKQEDLLNYVFEIPLKYQISKNSKIINEDKRIDGKIVKYYDNSVVEILNKNKNISRVKII